MTNESPRPATKEQLKWLNNGFDKKAFEALEKGYLKKATGASGTPPPWVFVEADPDELNVLGK